MTTVVWWSKSLSNDSGKEEKEISFGLVYLNRSGGEHFFSVLMLCMVSRLFASLLGEYPVANHDRGYKLIFSHQEMVRDLLLGFVKAEWVEQLDFDTLEKVSGSYVTDDLRDRQDDVIWRVRWKGRWLYLYLLLEFQSTVDWMMSVRMNAYVMLLYQDLVKSGQIRKGALLPPVLPMVLYNGKPVWTAARDVSDLITPMPGGLEQFRPRMQYLLVDEVRYDDATLVAMRNLVAALVRLEKSQSPADIREVLRNLIDWLKAPEQLSLRRAFTAMLGRLLLPRRMPGQTVPEFNDLQEVDAMLAETVQEWTKQWEAQGWQKGLQEGRLKGLQEGLQEGRQEGLQEGLQEGRQEGLQEGRREEAASFLLRLLQRRFGSLPADLTEKIRSADQPILETWGDRILDAKSLDDVFV